MKKIKRRNVHKKVLLDSIRKYEDPVLKKMCDAVTPDDTETLKTIQFMGKVLTAHERGVGLSANQVGISKRIIVIRPRGYNITALINPRITDGKGDVEDIEMCMSWPGSTAKVKRFEVIDIEYKDENFNFKYGTYRGFVARIIQHEIDHLNGICKVSPHYKE